MFAGGDSYTRAKLVPVWPRALGFGGPHSDPTAATKALLKSIIQRAADFDVIYAHVDWLFPWLDRLGVPFVTTPHDRLDVPGLLQAGAPLSRCSFYLDIRQPTHYWEMPIGRERCTMGFLPNPFVPSWRAEAILLFLGG